MKKLFVTLGLLPFLSCSHFQPHDNTSGAARSLLAELPTQNKESIGEKWAISTQGILSSQAAKRMFEQGGNIIDAAIAASFAISVERPQSTGLGGGGFFIYYRAQDKKAYALDFREQAPLCAHRDMFLDSNKNIIPHRSTEGIFAVGVPGFVAGMESLHRRWGKLSWQTILQPSIELAEKGFVVYPALAKALKEKQPVLAQDPYSKTIFLHANGQTLLENEILIQKDLATTLRKISKQGSKIFYSDFKKGTIASELLETSKRLNGCLTQNDLKNYQVKWRQPLIAEFNDKTLISMPPPSSGGTHVLEILNILNAFPLKTWGPYSPQSIHATSSAMQMAFADRAKFMGDPDFISIPLAGLISQRYAKERASHIDLQHAKKADEISAGQPPAIETNETTHLSIMTLDGDAISTTQTINGWMGAGIVAGKTGIVLNNEMDDFSSKTGAQNLFGAVGGDANSIEPKKRPLSSMSPTILTQNGQAIFSVGSPGGTRIITCTAQTLLNYFIYQRPLLESVTSLRYHHQWKPDEIQMETISSNQQSLYQNLPDSTLQSLKNMGYTLTPKEFPCRIMAIAKEQMNHKSYLRAVSDPRDIGTALAQ